MVFVLFVMLFPVWSEITLKPESTKYCLTHFHILNLLKTEKTGVLKMFFSGI